MQPDTLGFFSVPGSASCVHFGMSNCMPSTFFAYKCTHADNNNSHPANTINWAFLLCYDYYKFIAAICVDHNHTGIHESTNYVRLMINRIKSSCWTFSFAFAKCSTFQSSFFFCICSWYDIPSCSHKRSAHNISSMLPGVWTNVVHRDHYQS